MMSSAYMPQLLQWVHHPRFLPRRLPPRSTAILRRWCRCSSWREARQVMGRSCSCVVASSFRSDHLWVNICFSYTNLTTQCHGQFHSVEMGLQKCSTTPIVSNVGMCFLQLLLLLLIDVPTAATSPSPGVPLIYQLLHHLLLLAAPQR
jgi:hypothetical protein